jgi:hypothetical protein
MTNDDQRIHGKVVEIGVDEITFFKAQYPEGPSYKISIKGVCKIEYGTGRVEYFAKCKKQKERAEAKALRESSTSVLLSAGCERLALTAAYSIPLADFREGNDFSGPQALDGFTLGLNYFFQPSFLPKRVALQAGLSYSNYTARFDTSFAGLNVGGGGDFLNIQINPAQWSVADFTLAIPVCLIGSPRFECSIAPQVGAAYIFEPQLNGSSNFFILNTSFTNIPDNAVAFTFGGSVSVNFPIGEKFSAGAFANYTMGTFSLDTNYEFNINGTITNEQERLTYQYARLNVGFSLLHSLE